MVLAIAESGLGITFRIADPLPGSGHGEEIAKEPQDQDVITTAAAEPADDRPAGHTQIADR